MKLLGNADGGFEKLPVYHEFHHNSLVKSKPKVPKGMTPLQMAYTALILRHHELGQTIGLARTPEEKLKMHHFIQAYEEAIETLDQYRDHK